MGIVPVSVCEHCGSTLADSPFARFWLRVNKNGPIPERYPELGPCWLWTGAVFGEKEYGQFWLAQRNRRAHMVAWEWANGPIPDGLLVCHRCDRPRCVNPGHLFLGTHIENMLDRDAKGRMSHGPKHWLKSRPDHRQHAKGARNGVHTKPVRAKVTEADVLEIRRLSATGVRNRELAVRYGVNRSTISNIIHRRAWTHLP